MTILINAFSAKRGGGITYIKNFLENIPKSYNYKIIVLKTNKQQFHAKNKNIIYQNFNNLLSNPFILIIWEFFFLKRIIKINQIKIYFSPGGIISPSLKTSKIKKITMFRNMIPFDQALMKEWPPGYAKMRNWILSKQLLFSMKSADQVIFISKYGYSIIKKLIKDIDKRKKLIYHGVNNNFFRQNKKFQSNFPLNKKILQDGFIIYPSIIDVYKCQKEVIHAYQIAKKKIKSKIPKLLLIGEEYGDYSIKVRNLIKIYKLEKYIFVTGPIDHNFMPALYTKSEFTIFASKSENCPNILLEAMASGSGIICSNFKPMREFAEDTVEYFNPEKPKTLANKMIKLLENKKLIKVLGIKAKRKAKIYNWKKTTIETLNFFHSNM